MPASRRPLAAAAALALAGLLVTACSAAPEPAAPDETPNAQTPSAPAPQAGGTPEPEPSSTEDPTCDTLIGADVVADFGSVGWTSRAEPFYIGSLEVADGLQCMWADFGGSAGDHAQMFGWARISPSDAADAQTALVDQGWIREDAPEGVYITESPETTITADAEGYGMTYLFGDGWVKLADTKQGLLLIEWPRG